MLEVRGLKVHYPVGSGLLRKSSSVIRAVDDVSFTLRRGETLSIVGESGCGKSTLGRAIVRLGRPTGGEVWVDGARIDHLSGPALRRVRRRIQMILQDPFSSLNPRMRVRDILAEPIVNFEPGIDRAELDRRIAHLLESVQLPIQAANRFPHEFSGGQRQRIGIARALGSGAEIIVCDEAVSALDVSVKAQIVNLLVRLQGEFGLTLLFISHDLSIVERLTHNVGVMYLGKIVELASRSELFGAPRHPYTRALLSAVPIPDPTVTRQRIVLHGDVPSPISPPSGCRFHTRCPYAFQPCSEESPELRTDGTSGHKVACHLDALPPIPNIVPRPAKTSTNAI